MFWRLKPRAQAQRPGLESHQPVTCNRYVSRFQELTGPELPTFVSIKPTYMNVTVVYGTASVTAAVLYPRVNRQPQTVDSNCQPGPRSPPRGRRGPRCPPACVVRARAARPDMLAPLAAHLPEAHLARMTRLVVRLNCWPCPWGHDETRTSPRRWPDHCCLCDVYTSDFRRPAPPYRARAPQACLCWMRGSSFAPVLGPALP